MVTTPAPVQSPTQGDPVGVSVTVGVGPVGVVVGVPATAVWVGVRVRVRVGVNDAMRVAGGVRVIVGVGVAGLGSPMRTTISRGAPKLLILASLTRAATMVSPSGKAHALAISAQYWSRGALDENSRPGRSTYALAGNRSHLCSPAAVETAAHVVDVIDQVRIGVS
jgi:hypothetical protein